jgi:hypothetical protein
MLRRPKHSTIEVVAPKEEDPPPNTKLGYCPLNYTGSYSSKNRITRSIKFSLTDDDLPY